jgi:hypothetical protein
MLRSLAVFRALGFAGISLLLASMAAATPIPQDQPQDQQQYPQDQQQDQNAPYENFTPEQLENLLSPIALYPDPLLAQVFVAATFPDQVEEAARYVRANGPNGIDEQNWDVSVKAVAHYPTVIEMMADKIDWTTSIGQAYVNQSTDVARAVQHLRHLARSEGNLVSTPQEEVLEHDDYIAITPYQPQFIYVPVYDPAIIYFRRPYWGPAITFGVGFPIGAWLNLDFRWGFGGGWGGVYYTGWRREGWGGGCWNCGWIGRCRDRIDIRNNVYINNRYERINVNRTVINRTVNVNNISRYNSVHRNVSYNNIQHNNERVNRVNTGRAGNFGGNNGRPGNVSGRNDRPGNSPVGNNNRAGVNNKIMDRNIDRNNPRIDQYRGRDNNARNDRPPSATQQQRPTVENRQQARPVQQQRPQARPAPQPAARPAPHSFARNEGSFDPRQSSQRGQASRQQAAQPRAPARPAPQPRAQQSRPAPASRGGGGGGERKKP